MRLDSVLVPDGIEDPSLAYFLSNICDIKGHVEENKNCVENQPVFSGGLCKRSENEKGCKVHAVGLHIRYFCKCDTNESLGNCSCFSPKDLRATSLYLSRNDLTCARGLERFVHLESLSLSDNLFNAVPPELKQLNKLRRLHLIGNPMSNVPSLCLHYREQVLAMCPSLEILDGKCVTAKEVKRAHRVFSEECMLRNVVFLLGRVHRAVDTDGVTMSLLRMHEDILETLGIARENAATLEDYMCNLKISMDNYFLFDTNFMNVWLEMDFTKTSSMNAALGQLAAIKWTDILSMLSLINDGCIEDTFELFAENMSASIRSMEMAVCQSTEGCCDDLEGIVAMIFSHVYILVSSLERESISQNGNSGEFSEQSDGLRRVSDISADAADEKAVLEHEIETMKVNMQALHERIDDRENEIENLKRDKKGIETVLSLVQEKLELSKQKESQLTNQSDLNRANLESAIRERDKYENNLRQFEEKYKKSMEAVEARLIEQQKMYSCANKALQKKIDDMSNQPTILLNINIVSPDVSSALKSKEDRLVELHATIGCMTREMGLLELAHDFNAHWDKLRAQAALRDILNGWNEYSKYRMRLKNLENSISQVIFRRNKQNVLSMLGDAAWRCKRLESLAIRWQRDSQNSLKRLVFGTWRQSSQLSSQLHGFLEAKVNKERSKVLKILRDYAILSRAKRNSLFLRCRRVCELARLQTHFDTWIYVYRSDSLDRKLKEFEARKVSQNHTLKTFFSAWHAVKTREEQSREDDELSRLGDDLSNQRLKNKAFTALLKHKVVYLQRRHGMVTVQSMVRRGLLCKTLSAWRHENKEQRMALAREKFQLWRANTKLLSKMREGDARLLEKRNTVMRLVFGYWRTFTSGESRKWKQTVLLLSAEQKKKLMISKLFYRWYAKSMHSQLSKHKRAVAEGNLHVQLATSSCNALQAVLMEREKENMNTFQRYACDFKDIETSMKDRCRTLDAKYRDAVCRLHEKQHVQKQLSANNNALEIVVSNLKEQVVSLQRKNKHLQMQKDVAETLQKSAVTRASRAESDLCTASNVLIEKLTNKKQTSFT